MIKRQKFTIYYLDGVSFKHSGHLLGISYCTCKRWKQLYSENQLMVSHGLKDKTRNKTSSINKQTTTCEDLASPMLLLRNDDKGMPSPYNYVVTSKL